MISSTEIVIIGAGPAGMACAITLARANVRCIVIERNEAIQWKPGEIFDSRIRVPLQQLGVWEKFEQLGFLQASGTTSSWGGDFIEKSAMIDPYGGAYFADRNKFEELMQVSVQMSGAGLYKGFKVLQCHPSPTGWDFTLSKNAKSFHLKASYLIEANGRGISYCEEGERECYDKMVALLGYTAIPDNYADQRFYIEALNKGWAYFAPLPENQAVIALLTDAACLPKGLQAQQRFYTAQIKQLSLMHRLCLPQPDKIELHTTCAKSYIRKVISGEKWMAIGEAASTYDPICGWGVVSSLQKGIKSAELLLSCNAKNAGERYEEYERSQFSKYLQTRRRIYAQERRWMDESFWRERGGVVEMIG